MSKNSRSGRENSLPSFKFHQPVCFFRIAIFFSKLLLLWAFFRHVRVCCRRASTTVLQYYKYSTAQRDQPAQSRIASSCRSECDNAASKQTESAYCIALPQAQQSTSQSARTKPQSQYVSIRVRQRKEANRVSESQHIRVEHLYSTLRSPNE